MWTLFIFIAALAVLVLSHETGHFLAAKKSGMRVDEFGFGFPPRVWGFKKGETTYTINLIPFGGFVKIFGEDSAKPEPRSFSSRPIYQRMIVLVAGVFFNLVLAWVLFSATFAVGAPAIVDDGASGNIFILEVQPGTPAEKAGFLVGDQLLKISFGEEILEVKNVSGVHDFIFARKGEKITVEVLSGSGLGRRTIDVVPSAEPEDGKGALGIAMGKMGFVSYPLHKALWEGVKTTGLMIKLIVFGLGKLVADIFMGVPGVADQVAGPVGIYMIFDNASGLGFANVLFLVAYISTLLAIINFIPFPALDGGRVLFLIIEAIKGRPLSQKITNIANTAGFFFLIGLMLLVTFHDIIRLFN